MTKHEASNSAIDLKQFFEASLRTLNKESRSVETKTSAVQRNCALIQRAATDEILEKRAVADAARALTALWKMQRVI
jgi:hypothetical protein